VSCARCSEPGFDDRRLPAVAALIRKGKEEIWRMGLAGLRALTTVDSGMPTVTAARPFRWGWRCLGEQRTALSSKLRTFFACSRKTPITGRFWLPRPFGGCKGLFRNAKAAIGCRGTRGGKSNARLAFREMRPPSFPSPIERSPHRPKLGALRTAPDVGAECWSLAPPPFQSGPLVSVAP